jgi:hypothetical protein
MTNLLYNFFNKSPDKFPHSISPYFPFNINACLCLFTVGSNPPIPFDFKASHSSATSPPLTRLAAIEPVTTLHGWYTATASAARTSRNRQFQLFFSLFFLFYLFYCFFAGRGWCGRKRRPVCRGRLDVSGKAFSKRQTSERAGGLTVQLVSRTNWLENLAWCEGEKC